MRFLLAGALVTSGLTALWYGWKADRALTGLIKDLRARNEPPNLRR